MSTFALRIVFQAPGWFMNDPPTRVLLDGRVLHDGSFVAGFETTEHVSAGGHVLETEIDIGIASRRRKYEFVIDATDGYREKAPRWVARLEYSRFWGNFGRKLALARE